MKRIFCIILALLIILCSCDNAGYINTAEIIEVESEIYTEDEINSAINTVKSYFKRNFDGCVLWTVKYAGDETEKEAREWAEQYDSSKAIILLSDFSTDPEGGDGSLNPDERYTDWKWILTKDSHGRWEHKTHGYG